MSFRYAATFVAMILCGCAATIGPLGPVDPAPSRAERPLPANSKGGGGFEQREDSPFFWGFSTSSYQYEDPAEPPGSPMAFSTDWDLMVERGGAPPKGNALFSWSHFEKDLAVLRKIRPTHYRFSIEWARVEPRPGVYNEEAIRGYVRMARELRRLGIEPVICLWHFTFPAWLTNLQRPSESNWLHPLARSHWRTYVEKVVRATAPYTTFYAPQNEPNGQITTAYLVAQWPPRMTLAFGHYRRAIAESSGMFRDAAAIIRTIKPGAKILSVEALPWWQRDVLDPAGIIYNTMLHGNTDHLDRVYDVCDFIGINYYYSKHTDPVSILVSPNLRGRNFSMMGWRINPNGLKEQIRFVSRRYGKPVLITENGLASKSDPKRIKYLHDHLAAVSQILREGVDVRGFFVWSLADNYEWHYGYKSTFGLARMNPETKERELKPSAYWYRDVIHRHLTILSMKNFSAPQM